MNLIDDRMLIFIQPKINISISSCKKLIEVEKQTVRKKNPTKKKYQWLNRIDKDFRFQYQNIGNFYDWLHLIKMKTEKNCNHHFEMAKEKKNNFFLLEEKQQKIHIKSHLLRY